MLIGARLEIGQLLGIGRTAEIFDVGEGRIVKLLRPGFAEAILEEEAELATIVAARYPAAPRCMGLARIDGRLGIVYERVDGPTMDARVRARLWEASRRARELGALHATMHLCAGVGLQSQRSAMHAAVERGRLPADVAPAVHDRIDRLPTGSALCHGDLHPGNVLLGERAVVIDWGNATMGSAEADVARSLFLLRDAAMLNNPRGLMGRVANAVRARIAGTYLAAYQSARSVDPREIAGWRLPTLAARLAEGIAVERDWLRREIDVELRSAEYLASK